MRPYEELFRLLAVLDEQKALSSTASWMSGLDAIEKVANELKSSASGSWLGYHANVYYEGLKSAPPGAHFSQEWGLIDTFGSMGSSGEWREYDPKRVRQAILDQAGVSDLRIAMDSMGATAGVFDKAKSEIVSVLSSELMQHPDDFLSKLLAQVEPLECLSPLAVADRWHDKRQVMTRDMTALGQGTRVPPHIMILAEAASIRLPFRLCETAANIARKAASHLQRKDKARSADHRLGTNVFIGHGRSSAWRELKDFIRERLSLPFDEFNRVPVAGITNIARLSEMLDSAAIAFVIMTAEDELADGKMQARMNVIHEVGLFQGRLGFTKAIVLLEDGCEEFTNIQGLGQIRFPAGRISAVFEQVREVLEREGLLTV